ncbi:MAG: 1-acyl-sn-glycerol-3-phosphate acyltransferase [Treponema sp.]|nr:1-acyl-sn-glycerol-3-phosphate acyltransferase [Treponema sp.]
MATTLIEKYKSFFGQLMQNSTAAAKIDETNVYQEANPANRKLFSQIIEGNILPGSGFKNMDKIKSFYEQIVNEGKSGVVMMEHYSNADLPNFIYLLENSPEEWARDMASRIVPIAGMKLNESDPGVRAFTEGFTRVVVYPTRSQDAMRASGATEAEIEEEVARAKKINFAAMRAMDVCKKRGQIILVFPSGTRYRPGKPETKRGLREMDSYLRLFDIMLPVANNGTWLTINTVNPESMLEDIVEPAVCTLTACDIVNCKDFRKQVLATCPEDCPDPKQYTVDAMMKIMEDMHEKVDAESK